MATAHDIARLDEQVRRLITTGHEAVVRGVIDEIVAAYAASAEVDMAGRRMADRLRDYAEAADIRAAFDRVRAYAGEILACERLTIRRQRGDTDGLASVVLDAAHDDAFEDARRRLSLAARTIGQ